MNIHVPKERITSGATALSQPVAAQQRPIIHDPSALPDRYGMIAEGVCLEPAIADGACLLFDKNAPIARGDFVILFKRPEIVKPGQHQAIVKRLVMPPPPWVKFPYREHPESEVRALVIAEQFNPRATFAIPCEDLLAIHKCLGPVPANMRRVMVTEATVEAGCNRKAQKKRSPALAG